MEDTRKRLEFGNPFIQEQAIWKLLGEISRKKLTDKITIQTPEIPELKLLWDIVTGDKDTLALTAGQALLQLVLSQTADFNYVLNGILNLIPSARSLGGLVSTLGELLVLQALVMQEAAEDHIYRCPYTLRSPTHPFITVLTNRPTSWQLLLAQVEDICLHRDSRVRKLSDEILRPFLKFVLLEPCPSHPEMMMREKLQYLLVDVCSRSDSNQVTDLLVDLLPCYQVTTMDGVASLTFHARQLLHLLQAPTVRNSMVPWDRKRAIVAYSALTLLLPNVRHKLDIQELVATLVSAVDSSPEIMGYCRWYSELTHILMVLGPFCPPAVLQLVDKALSAVTADSCGADMALLVLPLLQFLAMPSPATGQGTHKTGHGIDSYRKVVHAAASALKKVESLIQQFTDKPVSQVRSTEEYFPHLFSESLERHIQTRLFCVVASSKAARLQWLSHLQETIMDQKGTQTVSVQTTCEVSALMVVQRDSEVLNQALGVLVNIARLDPTKAPYFLPLLLYCLSRETVPETRLLLLDHIPRMAQHKFCIAPILKTLQTLAATQKLCPVAIRLMTSLWQLQDRCFPHLLKTIGEGDTKSKSAELSFDIILAKAEAIKDICHSKPEQHGAGLLALLSSVLQTAVDEEGGAPCALALEGLYHLCEAEVTDIQSVWSVLSKQLASEQRPAVIEKICELFSLVPSLAINTPEYEKFQAECVTSLWKYAWNSDSLVQRAAFQALASYSLDNFRVSHLPRQVCEDLYQQIIMMQQQQEKENLSIDEVFTFIPGVSFTRLLHSLSEPVLDDYGGFLSSMVGKEVDSLPRGIYHSSTRQQGTARSQDKAINTIPSFISIQYNRTKQPGLRPSLAAALLFSYDPPVEVGRDGRPRKHYLIKHGKQFLDTFRTLLNEVPVQPSEWHRTMLMPQAWQSFVERVFLAVIESRKAELELQLKHSHISEDQLDEKSNTAWLFARDSIVDILKTASRGNPSIQANSVLALSGAIVSVSHFAASLDDRSMKDSDAATEHLGHAHWLSVAIDTILSLWNINYKPYGKLLGLCQQRSVDDRIPASTLTQATACICLAPLIPILISSNSDLVFYIMHEMSQSLPGKPKASDVPVIQFHTGLGFGSLLGRMFEEHFSDVSGKKGMLEVWKCTKSLEDCCINEKEENRAGCLLGLGLALTGLCGEGKTDSRVHVAVMHEKLFTLMEHTPVEHNSYQAICFAVACITGTAYAANILPVERVNVVLHLLEVIQKQNMQVMGVGLSLAMLCYSLSKMGHPGVTDLRQVLTRQWLKAVSSQDTAPMEKVTALNGLMAMIGSEQSLIVVQSGVSLVSSDIKVSEVIEAVTKIVQGDPDLGIQCNASWMLGHLYLSACAVAEARASVPPTYSYLPEASILRSLLDFLMEAGRHGPEFASESQVKVVLSAIQDEVRQVLPPVNWAGVLSPLMRMPFGDECVRLCLSLAVSQSASSPTATMFLASWMTPPLFMTLNAINMKELYCSLPKLVKSVPLSVLTTFLERSCCLPLAAETFDAGLAVSVMQGLSASLRIPDPPQSVMAILFQTTGKMYSMMSSNLNYFQQSLFGSIAECLSNVPDEILDSITVKDYTSGSCSLCGFYVGCYLVAGGHQPITLLNGLIDSAINNPQCDQNILLYCLAHCFWESVRHCTETAGPMARLNWIVELLGHTRNIGRGSVPLTSPEQSLSRAVEFAAIVVAMALNLLTVSQPLPDFGLDPGFFKIKEDPKYEGGNKAGELTLALPGWSTELKKIFLQLLPSSVKKLEQTPWDQLLPKIMEWLMTMDGVSESLSMPEWTGIFKASQVMLRHSSEFRKMTNWTKILASV